MAYFQTVKIIMAYFHLTVYKKVGGDLPPILFKKKYVCMVLNSNEILPAFSVTIYHKKYFLGPKLPFVLVFRWR
jgi:hypothetical protein